MKLSNLLILIVLLGLALTACSQPGDKTSTQPSPPQTRTSSDQTGQPNMQEPHYGFSGQAVADIGGMTEQIVQEVNGVFADQGIAIKAEDVDYSKAYQIYVDTNIFRLEANQAQAVKAALENGIYVYSLPISQEKGTVVLNLQKGLPLREEAKAVLSDQEKEEVAANAGSWVISRLAFYNKGDFRYDYGGNLAGKLGQISPDTLLVGSLPVFGEPVALLINEEGVIDRLVALADNYDQGLVKEAQVGPYQYDYRQIKEIINHLPEPDPDKAG